LPATKVILLKGVINQSKTGKSLLVTFHEGYSTYTMAVPMPFAVRFFAEGLVAALETLNQDSEMQEKLNENEGQKAEIHERLRKSAKLFETYLAASGR
jgi:hypothetical protein